MSVAPTFALAAPSQAVTFEGPRPRIRRGTVRRDRLVRGLARSSAAPLVIVRAPAGYGKTTLLSQWNERDGRPFAWIEPELLHAGAAFESAARALRELPSPAVAVLDGAPVEAGFDEIEAWARELPAGSQVAIATRGEPSLPLGSLRAHGLVAELGASELAMTRREAAAMLSMAGVEVEPADQSALLLRTEGWPAALYLAALAIRGGRDPHAVVRFAGDDRLMADYLRDEILLRLPPPAVEFLLSTSVLERLSGPSCDALLGRAGSGEVLRELSRGGVPLVPLDDADAEYRHHPLLAEMLRAEQRRRDPQRTADLHRRAGTWLEREGEIEDALGHALAAGDVAGAGSRLWSIAASHIAHGRIDAIRTWLDRCRPEEISSHAPLALSAACTHLVDGDRDRLEHWLDTAERLIAAGEEIEDPPAAAACAVLRALLARDGVSRMVDDAATAYELTAEDDPWRPLACMLHGAGMHLLGTPELAVPVLEEGARRGGVVAPVAQVLCLAQLALIRADDEDWEEAALVASRARAQLDRVNIARYPSAALVYAVSALVRSHRDRVEAAQDDRRRAGALLARLVDPPPWYAVETRVALARTTLRLGDAVGARALLSEAGRMLPAMTDAPLAGRWVEEGGAQADAFAASVFAGPASLTNAELRVLRLLPTHLSFREMGLSLHVTANTVKTHAHAVYRKLDASSRSEAVVHARGIGLLDDLGVSCEGSA